MKMIEVRNLRYDILNEIIIKDFNFQMKSGEIYTLFGASGCGKTTLLRLISQLEKPKKGEIINQFEKTTYLFQENRLLNNLNVLENIRLCASDVGDDEIYYHLKMVGFQKRDLYKYPNELSGGMAKRVAFMRAYLSKPDLMLLDEPFSGLDMDLKNLLVNLIIQKVEKKELSCILVTHDRFEAVLLSHKINFLTKKGMKVYKILEIEQSLKNRDMAFIQNVINNEFKETIYYD
ncbi:ATP-binding cassette domain-containing protein [Campylobacter ureolyticus]|uniref:Nitrate/sulfonate/bicarbonate ABC transporter, ATP-binding protein n=1 Tax=Campylobacter ureolyticus TaxID=827 RepID=A0AAE7EA04_9BACT|nr:ATP-binding cassette domain-containing protein [Campylobacter ureolyticus]MCR8684332.1 ATP-binding cassette domain-containing protein [Campylobacter ureolyticus]QKF84363.1 nitrate/sulfonate/bicarbonate ABC transporter, ATP-binding protein [Campylobacter ureolyticus]QQY35478.1 ABC transporter ATP-binding protein [Campylobacter ureolyticus]SUX23077.1 nitrate transport ATP-binding protein NrtC [Campylobacter ureolyticus]